MPGQGRICVGIPTVYRAQNYVKECVDSLVAKAGSASTYEVLVMDFTERPSGSGEADSLTSWPPQARYEKYEGGTLRSTVYRQTSVTRLSASGSAPSSASTRVCSSSELR